MRTRYLLPLLAALALAPTLAGARSVVTDPALPRALPADGPVSVEWTDPAQFTELRYSRNRWDAQRGDWVEDLAEHLRKQASKQLPEGQKLEVTITDIKRAGDYEPWHGSRLDDVRIMRDIYPPRISLQFTLTDANGQIIDQGERKLSDTGYLLNSSLPNNTDPLRYEKRLLNDWVRRELQSDRSTAGL